MFYHLFAQYSKYLSEKNTTILMTGLYLIMQLYDTYIFIIALS